MGRMSQRDGKDEPERCNEEWGELLTRR